MHHPDNQSDFPEYPHPEDERPARQARHDASTRPITPPDTDPAHEAQPRQPYSSTSAPSDNTNQPSRSDSSYGSSGYQSQPLSALHSQSEKPSSLPSHHAGETSTTRPYENYGYSGTNPAQNQFDQSTQPQQPPPYTYGSQYNQHSTSPDAWTPQEQQPPYDPSYPTSDHGYKKWTTRALIGAIIAALLLGGIGGWIIKSSNSTGDTNMTGLGGRNAPVTTAEKVADKFLTSVVQINVQQEQNNGLGSGVIIDKRGYIVTNNHVIKDAQKLQVVLYNGTALDAQLVGTDPPDDLAVVHINPPSNMTVASIGDSSKLRVGQPVLAIGNPLGITQTVTSGIVSARRTVPEGQGSNTVIINAVQTDAAINPGNSGGALVDMNGQLIGIPTLVPIDPTFNTPAAGVGFAIPSNRAMFISKQLITDGKVMHSGRADLGARVITVDSFIASQDHLSVNQGALVVNVSPGSSAQQAGLKAGDVITQVDGQALNSAESLVDILTQKEPGDTVTLKIARGTQQMNVKVKLGELQIK